MTNPTPQNDWRNKLKDIFNRKYRTWAFWTDEALKIGYIQQENMEIVGESRDGKDYHVTWPGIKSRYKYPKELFRTESLQDTEIDELISSLLASKQKEIVEGLEGKFVSWRGKKIDFDYPTESEKYNHDLWNAEGFNSALSSAQALVKNKLQ